MKKDKELKYKYGKLAESMVQYYDHLDLRLLDDLDDEDFAYIMKNVRGVNMLDLNETEITNESIGLISKLEYVKELRAKSCRKLDDGCVADLNKITGLEFLHVKDTGISIDGLLKLNALTHLKTVLFSEVNVDSIKEKMLDLIAIHPGCVFVIDGKGYYFNSIDRFIHFLKGKPYSYKLKIRNEPVVEAWSSWLIHPSESYMEAEAQGPYSLNDIEWIDIDPRKLSDTEAITKFLDEISFPWMITDGIISVYVINKSS